jgi:phospholipase C
LLKQRTVPGNVARAGVIMKNSETAATAPPAARGVTRREVLGKLGAGLGASLLPGACSLGPDVCGEGPPAARPPSARDAEAHALLRHIDTFIVVMLENRSFDHLLGGLQLDCGYAGSARIAGLRGDESNRDREGRIVRVARMPGDGRGNLNPEHDWRSVRATFNGGRNDGFVRVNAGPHEAEVMSYLTRDQVPLFHHLADHYTVFDHWYASYMGQTWPNRAFLHATTSGGKLDNQPFGWDAPIGIWERMAQRCLSTRNYAAGSVLWYAVAFPVRLFSGDSALVPGRIEDFFHDARSGNLPNFALIDPDFKVNDAYPMHSPAPCEAFIASIIKAVAEGPQWSRSLILITFDEHGGYFDHVVPPTTVDLRPAFRQLGFRVPAIAVGPTVRQGAVVSTPLEHASVAATLRARWGIESLSARMDATADISGCIDPGLIAAPAPPPRAFDPVELSERSFARLFADRTSQPEIEAALAAKRVPEGLVDPRAQEERFRSWLRHAQELAAVRVRP